MRLFLKMLVALVSTTRQATEASAIHGLLCAALEGIASRNWAERQEEIERFVVDACIAMGQLDMLEYLMNTYLLVYVPKHLAELEALREPPHPEDCQCPDCDHRREQASLSAHAALIEEAEAEASVGDSSIVEAELTASAERVLDEEERHEPDDPLCTCGLAILSGKRSTPT